VARALIVGCGCSGRSLGGELAERGWHVRGTSRGEEIGAIGRSGLEAAVADPDRPGTVLDLVADVAVIVWLLGSATGPPEQLEAIHGPRLRALLERLVDTPVRGLAYEAAGSVDAALLRRGGEVARRASATWRLRVAQLRLERPEVGWAAAAADEVESLLGRR
jgi:hypothetical protein